MESKDIQKIEMFIKQLFFFISATQQKTTHRISAQHNGEENTYGIGIC